MIPGCIFQEAQRALGELDGKYSECEKTQDELQKEDSRVRHEKVESFTRKFLRVG